MCVHAYVCVYACVCVSHNKLEVSEAFYFLNSAQEYSTQGLNLGTLDTKATTTATTTTTTTPLKRELRTSLSPDEQRDPWSHYCYYKRVLPLPSFVGGSGPHLIPSLVTWAIQSFLFRFFGGIL